MYAMCVHSLLCICLFNIIGFDFSGCKNTIFFLITHKRIKISEKRIKHTHFLLFRIIQIYFITLVILKTSKAIIKPKSMAIPAQNMFSPAVMSSIHRFTHVPIAMRQQQPITLHIIIFLMQITSEIAFLIKIIFSDKRHQNAPL